MFGMKIVVSEDMQPGEWALVQPQYESAYLKWLKVRNGTRGSEGRSGAEGRASGTKEVWAKDERGAKADSGAGE